MLIPMRDSLPWPWQAWKERRRVAMMRARAIEYADAEWPVIPVALPVEEGCPCRADEAHDRPHPVAGPTTDPTEVAEHWREEPWGIALSAGVAFDILEMPPQLGVKLHDKLRATCATAITPSKNWQFIVTPGLRLTAALIGAGVVRHGKGSCVMASPTHTDQGRVYWLVDPAEVHWQPYDGARVLDALHLAISDENEDTRGPWSAAS